MVCIWLRVVHKKWTNNIMLKTVRFTHAHLVSHRMSFKGVREVDLRLKI